MVDRRQWRDPESHNGYEAYILLQYEEAVRVQCAVFMFVM